MASVRKVLLAPGVYSSPDGTVHATPARIRHWISQGKAMRQRGLRIPLCWGHQPRAKPATEAEAALQEYWKSRFNAGYLDDLEEDENGALVGVLHAPGLTLDEASQCLIDQNTKSAIGEVSIAFDDFKDGTAQTWKDAIVHVALTPHPVWHGQEGFSATAGEPALRRLSLSGFLHRFSLDETGAAMPDEPKKDEPKKDAPDGAGGGDLKKVLELLAGKDIVLPDDTSMENLLERLVVALTALGAGGGTEPPALEPELPKEEKVEEEPPAMMSLAERVQKDPVLAGLLAREERRGRLDREKRIGSLVRRGLPVHVASDLRQQAGTVHLSLTATGDFEETEIDRSLALLEKALPPEDVYESHASGKVEEVIAPEGLTNDRANQIANGIARAIGVR